MKNQTVFFAVGAGNFGGPRSGTKIIECQPKPKRKPDATLIQKTSIDQAALYRLSGNEIVTFLLITNLLHTFN